MGCKSSTPIQNEVKNNILAICEEMGFPSRVRDSAYFDDESTYMKKGVFYCKRGHYNECIFKFVVTGCITTKEDTPVELSVKRHSDYKEKLRDGCIFILVQLF